MGDAEVGLGHLDAAIEEYEKAIDVGYHNRVVNMAGAYALQGKMDEAKSSAEALRANPKLTVKMLTERFAIPPVLAEGLRKAGLAETSQSAPRQLLEAAQLSRPAPRSRKDRLTSDAADPFVYLELPLGVEGGQLRSEQRSSLKGGERT